MLLQAATQIAGTIKIDHGYRRIVQLSSKLKEEKRYLEEELAHRVQLRGDRR